MKLIICPLAELDAALASSPSHVLSLLSPDAAMPLCTGIPASRRLMLRFNDINGPVAGLKHVQPEDIENLICFARDWNGEAPFLTHCWAGISRSTAAAYIIACLLGAERQEEHYARALRAAAPEATPNPLMIAIADDLLRRSGRMVRAIAGIGRGREAGQGTLFTLNLGT